MSASRSRVLALIVASIGLLVLHAPRAASERDSAELLPDLRPRRPGDVVTEGRRGTRLLRFDNEVVNKGIGPLEVLPVRTDCDGDGRVSAEAVALQRIYRDADGDSIFRRRVDERRVTSEAGCLRYHAATGHNHWHLADFALHELLAYKKSGKLGHAVASSPKISFCLIDSRRRRGDLAGSPVRPYYGPRACKRNGVTGISVGWSDWYAAYLPGQELDITGVAAGTYCLRSTIDPVGKLRELREWNNRRGVRVRITRRAAVPAKAGGCGSG